MGDKGLEPCPKSPDKTHIPKQGSSECGAPRAKSIETDPNLARIIELWPRLTEPLRRSLVLLVENSNTLI